MASKSSQISSPNIWVNTTQLAPPWTQDKLNQGHQLWAARLTHAEPWPQQGSVTQATGVSQECDRGTTGTFKGKLPVLLPQASGRGRWLLGGNGVPCRRHRKQGRRPASPLVEVLPPHADGSRGEAGGPVTVDTAPGWVYPSPVLTQASGRRIESGSHFLPPSHESPQIETWVWEMHRLP